MTDARFPTPLILASTSRYRRELLTRLGVPFVSIVPNFDEEGPKESGMAPRQLAEFLALGKANSVAERYPNATVIGSDQLAAVDGQVLGKPGSEIVAQAQLAQLAGRTHELITAVAVVAGGVAHQFVDITRLRMRPLSAAAIARYVERDEPLDCAGGYKLEGQGITLFEAIESADHTAIIGLPLIALTTVLRQLGFDIP